MATNKRNVDRMVEVIDNASRHARMLYYLYLGFIAYCAVTVFSTTDRQLALKGDKAELPILDISVSLDGFFLLAPLLAIGLFVYFMLYLHRLNSLVDDLFEVDPSYNKKDLYPWMINIARETEKGIIGFLQRLFVGLTLWFTLPVTMFIFASKFVKKHEDIRSQIIVGLAFISILIVIWFWNQFNSSKKLGELREVFYSLLISLVIVAGWYGTIMLIPQINDGEHRWANLDLRNELLVTVPDKDKDFKGVYWADLEGVNLNGADLTSAVLKRANLRNAELNKAELFKANLQEAHLVDANLRGAFLGNANLQEANLKNANLRGAYLGNANLREANLGNANLRGALLQYANLQEANLKNANLREANLNDANLREANLWLANLQMAKLWNANLQEASLQDANLQGALLRDANLREANLSFAMLSNFTHLPKKQLCNAGTLYEIRIDEDLFNAIISDKDCAYKITKESYVKWIEKVSQLK